LGSGRRLLTEEGVQIRIGSTLGSHESAKRGEKRPNGRSALPKTRDPDPSSDFRNSFWNMNSRKFAPD
jgi:hypothetical protein